MSQRIHLAAIVVRDGRLLLHRPGPGLPWELPGAPLPPEHDDVDAGMDAILARFGISAPAIEEDFVETVHLSSADGHVVYNLYAPTEWTGEPGPVEGIEDGWFALDELEALPMDAGVRDAVLAAFGLRERRDPAGAIMAAINEAVGASARPPFELPARPVSRREAGLDVLRTLSGGDPRAESALRAATPELADAILEFSMGDAWQHPALDRRTRSLLVIAMLAALGHRQSLRAHVGAALNHGATPDQVVQTLRMVAVYAGLPAAGDAWPVMEEVFAERGIPRPGSRP